MNCASSLLFFWSVAFPPLVSENQRTSSLLILHTFGWFGGGVGILLISHQEITKEGLQREGSGLRSVWDLGIMLVVAAIRMTPNTNTHLTTRISPKHVHSSQLLSAS